MSTADLPEPEFVHRDAERVLRECIEFVESPVTGLGRALQPGQVERVMVDLIAYREMVLRHALQDAGKQTLVRFARFPMIDYHADLVGTARLPARAATTSLVFVFAVPLEAPLPIPAGFEVGSQDRKVVFATDSEVVLAPGATGVTLPATCTQAGAAGNGYGPGQISRLLGTLGVVATVANTTTTTGGAPSETTEALRERIPEAVRALSTAGPRAAYRFWAKAAHPDVLDVDPSSPEPGLARLAVLSRAGDGVPTSAVLEAVEEMFEDEEITPWLDTVEVVAAEPVDYALVVELTLRRSRIGTAETAASLAAATERAEAFALGLKQQLGRSLILTQLYAAVMGPDIYNAAFPGLDEDIEVSSHQWPRPTTITVSVVAYEGAA
jgi:phage-related baseplate assembly protein